MEIYEDDEHQDHYCGMYTTIVLSCYNEMGKGCGRGLDEWWRKQYGTGGGEGYAGGEGDNCGRGLGKGRGSGYGFHYISGKG